jgi:GDP-4-dehydro-6-deoxy-D-mannose reductase
MGYSSNRNIKEQKKVRVLITGATGFIGSYLSSFLHEEGDEVYGTKYGIDHSMEFGTVPDIKLFECDIRDGKAVDSLIQKIAPDRIYHLAAQSFPTVSWKDPITTVMTNIVGTINVFEPLIKHKLDTRVLVACSSAEYGLSIESGIPVKEDHPLKPLHPYGVSKVAQDMLAFQYFVNFGIPAVRIRIFNTTGPGKTNDVCSDFAKRIVEAEKSRSKKSAIKVGNLTARRDITDVRDTIKGLYLAMEKGTLGEVYNLSRGDTYQISDILKILLSLSRKHIDVEVDKDLLRPTDEPVIVGNSENLYRQTGWKPAIPIEKTLDDMINFWRERV